MSKPSLPQLKVLLPGAFTEFLSYPEVHKVSSAVPQGSILSPPFFLAYINDLVESLQSDIKLFEDDTSILFWLPRTKMKQLRALMRPWKECSFRLDNERCSLIVVFSVGGSKIDNPSLNLRLNATLDSKIDTISVLICCGLISILIHKAHSN